MIRVVKYTFLMLLSLCAVVRAAAIAIEPCLIPQPRVVNVVEGVFEVTKHATIAVEDVALTPIAEYLSCYTGLSVDRDDAAIYLSINDRLGSEEYVLCINADGVTIEGGDYGGVFYGVVSLMQLMPSEVYSSSLCLPFVLPCCEISDSPSFEHRGFMLDVCRTWIDKQALCAFIDVLAYHKINNLRLHLTDDEAWRLEIKSHPELAEEGGFRGGDAKIWPRYGKWQERWGGYYTQEDMREIIEYARVRNIEIVPEIDLPGHSLCIATLHPEILCDYTPNTSAAFGYDTRSAFCASKEENYVLLGDILKEVCELFDSQYIHIGGDEVDMSQWRRCPDCRQFMVDNDMDSTDELQRYFMSRLATILHEHGNLPAVWNEAIDGGQLSVGTRVYGWESVAECRKAAAQGYPTIVMPGQYFYFDMKQSSREAGHDWAAIFDWRKVYNFSLSSEGFTSAEQQNIVGFEASFFSEAYASHNPESADFLHYQTFPRMVAFAEIAWRDCVRDEQKFYRNMVAHYSRMDAMGVAYRLMPPSVSYADGVLSAQVDDESDIYYRREPMATEMLYVGPITTNSPGEYSFISRRGVARSPKTAVASHFKTIMPSFVITSSIGDREKFSYEKAQGYGRIARTQRAADVGDWVMFTFDEPVKCRRMKVATGNFQLPRYIFESGFVEVSYDGVAFERVGDLDCGMFFIDYPARAIKAVRITCTSRGNGAEWVSIQPPTIYPLL
jgi:hexosaminidase